MAILKCPHCEHAKEVSNQYAGKMVKCPACGQTAHVYDTVTLLTAFSEQLSEFQTEIEALKQKVENGGRSPENTHEELTQGLNKVFREQRIAMSEFNDASKRREIMTLRIEKRAQKIIWLGLAGFLILSVITLFYIMQSTENTKLLFEHSLALNGRVKTMNQDLNGVRENVVKLASVVNNSTLQKQVTDSVGAMQEKVKELNSSVVQVREQLKELSQKNDNMLRYYPYTYR